MYQEEPRYHSERYQNEPRYQEPEPVPEPVTSRYYDEEPVTSRYIYNKEPVTSRYYNYEEEQPEMTRKPDNEIIDYTKVPPREKFYENEAVRQVEPPLYAVKTVKPPTYVPKTTYKYEHDYQQELPIRPEAMPESKPSIVTSLCCFVICCIHLKVALSWCKEKSWLNAKITFILSVLR